MERELYDMIQLDRALGGMGQFQTKEPAGPLPEQFFAPSPLTEEAYGKLCCVLEQEIKAYLDILHKTTNLNLNEKAQEQIAIREQCGLQRQNLKWDDWRTQCRLKMEEAMKL